MKFNNPDMLYLLFLIPLIVLLHLLYKKKRTVWISSLLLWQQILTESKKRYFLRKFFNNINLILQILIVAALCFSLADPYVTGKTQAGEKGIILILDNSASMKTIENGEARYETARTKALELIGSLHKDSRVMIIKAGAGPELLTAFTRDRSKLNKLIKEYNPSEEAGNIEAALYMAASLTDREKQERIVLISDGAFNITVEKFEGLDFEFIQTGETDDNVGITMFEFRKPLSDPDEYEILISLENYSIHPVSTNLEIKVDNRTIAMEQISLEGGEKETRILLYKGLIAGRAVAELDIDDSFGVDNRAYAVLSSLKTLEILLVTPGNFFLENLLSIHPNTNVTSAAAYSENNNYDIYIFDRITPDRLVPGNYLLIDSVPLGAPMKLTGYVYNPVITSESQNHPILNSLNLNTMKISEAMVTVAADNVISIVGSRETSLISIWQTDRIKAVFLGFDILKSDLPLKAAFPVLMGNIFTYLYPGSLSSSFHQIQAGSPYEIPFIRQENITVTRPDGETEMVTITAGSSFYQNTSLTGFYTVNRERESYFAVNLVSSEESNILPRFIKTRDMGSGESRDFTEKGRRQLWPIFAILAFSGFLLEWYFRVRKW